ncbi:hypothetical protein [Duganella callida]|uniref:hypothetical protein n=1 Tax=Duganella callida TaxID=2561932 RepID=UPI001430ABBF|nr:hypothetical protein [Duganella callida]
MKLRCIVGLHKWTYTSNTTRQCAHCGKAQRLDEESARDWVEANWLDEPKQ